MEVVIYFAIFCLQPLSIHLFTVFSSLCVALRSFVVFENNAVFYALICLSLIIVQMLFSPFLLCVVWVWSNLYITALNTHQWYLSTFGTAYAKMNKGVLFPTLCKGCGDLK